MSILSNDAGAQHIKLISLMMTHRFHLPASSDGRVDLTTGQHNHSSRSCAGIITVTAQLCHVSVTHKPSPLCARGVTHTCVGGLHAIADRRRHMLQRIIAAAAAAETLVALREARGKDKLHLITRCAVGSPTQMPDVAIQLRSCSCRGRWS